MDKKELEYLLDYAERHNLMKAPFVEVYSMWSKEINDYYNNPVNNNK